MYINKRYRELIVRDINIVILNNEATITGSVFAKDIDKAYSTMLSTVTRYIFDCSNATITGGTTGNQGKLRKLQIVGYAPALLISGEDTSYNNIYVFNPFNITSRSRATVNANQLFNSVQIIFTIPLS